MDAKDKALVAKTEPNDWKLKDLRDFWLHQNEPDIARQCEYLIGRMTALKITGAVDAEKRVQAQYLGEIYINPGISAQPIKRGQVVEMAESQLKYVMDTFPGQWQKVKVDKGEKVIEGPDTPGDGESNAAKLRRN